MFGWVNNHGLEVIVIYLAFTAFVGSMPPVSTNANYWLRWLFAFLHAMSMNLRVAMDMMKVHVPKSQDEKKKED